MKAATALAGLWVAALGLMAALPGSAQPVVLRIEASQESKLPTNAFFNPANLQAFEARYPGIKLELVLHPDALTLNSFKAALSGDNPPDLMVYSKVAAENELNAAATMQDLSGEAWARRLLHPEALRSPDGRMYIFQRALDDGGIGVVYNRAIFEKLGLSVPRTYADFLASCERLKKAGYIPLYGPFKDTWTFQIWTTAAWGTLVSRLKPGLMAELNSGHLHWQDVPEFRESLARGLELAKRGYFQPTMLRDEYKDAAQAFLGGRYAMMLMTHSFLVAMRESSPGLRLDMFAVPAFDRPEDNLISQGQVGGAFIPKKSRHKAEAALFLDFLAQPEQIARDLADPLLAYEPNFSDLQVKYARNPVLKSLYSSYIQPGRVSTEFNAYVKVGVTDLWIYYQDMLAGLKTPEQVLQAWDRKFRLLMRQKGFPGF